MTRDATRGERLALRMIEGWVRAYTRGLERDVADDRVAELRSDLAEQHRHQRETGTRPSFAAVALLSRSARGAAADLAWRSRMVRARRQPMTSRSLHEWTTGMRRVFWLLAVAVITSACGVFILLRLAILDADALASGGWIALALTVATMADVAGLTMLVGRPGPRAGAMVLAVASPVTFWLADYAPAISVSAFGTTLTAAIIDSGVVGLAILVAAGTGSAWLFLRGARRLPPNGNTSSRRE